MKMSVGQKIKWTLLGVVGLAFLLFMTLVIHIAVMVYHKPPLPFAYVQMARVDFATNLDSTQKSDIRKQLMAEKGMKTTYFNNLSHNVVYTFDNRQNSSEHIFSQVFQKSALGAKRYIVTESDLAKGCPVMNNNSFYGKLTTFISNTIN